jgi:arginine-tRNA-protein transferase
MRHQALPAENRSVDHALVMVHDQPQPCPYLNNRQARMPLHWPTRAIDPLLLDDFMEAGFRRSGSFLYRTQCIGCQACEPSRVDVDQFRLTRSFRRVLRRGDQLLTVHIGDPKVDAHRLELLNRHRQSRDLALASGPLDESDYRAFLIDSCCDTREMDYFLGDQLVAVATIDLGKTSLSAVYCYFDPDYQRLSLGTYSILKQIEFARQTDRQFVYLGMYVQQNPHLNYKARFTPQQRRCGENWQWFGEQTEKVDNGQGVPSHKR